MNDSVLIASLKQSFIFEDLTDAQYAVLIQNLQPEYQEYEKDQIIFYEADPVTRFGLVIDGVVSGYKVSIDGRESIVQFCRKNHFFAVEFAASSHNHSLFCYRCLENACVYFFSYQKILHTDYDEALKQTILNRLVDLLTIRSQKSFERMEILEQNSLRTRILLYLQLMSKRRGSAQFTICANRKEMAEFLSVNRSALSNELRKMKEDHLIDYDKNCFRIIKTS